MEKINNVSISYAQKIQNVGQIVKREFIWPFSGKKQKVDRSGSYKIQYNNPDDWEDPNQIVP